MNHYAVEIKYRKSKISVIIEKKELTNFISRYSKGAKEINVKEVFFDD
ncbi:hypothetical protein [Methanobrevibacter sp.]